MEASNSPRSESRPPSLRPPSLRRTLETLRQTAISFQQSFSLNWNDIVERLECCNSAVEARCAEIGEKESLISLRLEEVVKREAELDSLRVSLEAKLEEVAKKEEECEGVFAELRAVEECVDDRKRRTEAVRLSLERRVKEEEGRIEGEMRECGRVLKELRGKEKEVEERRKGLEAKEREYEKKLEEVERLKLMEKEAREEVELRELRFKEKLGEVERFKQGVFEECKKKLEEVERISHSVSEALKLKESEFEKQQNEVKLNEVQCKKRLEELIRLKQSVSEAAKLKEKELEKQQKGLELKEMEFKKKLEEFEKSKLVDSEESKRNEKELEKQQKGVKLTEMEFGKKLEELERSKQIASDAFNLKKEVEKQRKEVELKEKQYKKKLEELERDKERILKDLKIKQNHVEKQRKDQDLKEKNLDERFNVLRSKEMEIKKQNEELNLREQKCEMKSKENELENKQILASRKEVDLKNMKFIERVKEEEEKIDQQLKEIEFEKNQLVIRRELAEMEYQKLMQRVKELELKEKLQEERFREVILEEKKSADTIYTQVKREPLEIDDVSTDASLCFNVKMDGKALQQFLNERERDHDLLRNEVTAALGFSSNPAKLVLDAMQGFYPPHLKKGDVGFKEDVVRRSCILLLEQLRKISPPIKPRVKEEAKELAFEWKRKMRLRAGHEHSLEVLGFLQLLAAYKLASEFNGDDLLRCLETIAYYSKAPELFRVLGFAVQITSFVQRLVRKKKCVEAIGFVYAFDLVSEFPPVPLLKGFLKFSRISGRKVSGNLNDSAAKIEGLYPKREDVKNVLKCIQDHKIESDISPKQLELQISDLEKQIAEQRKKMPEPVFTISSSPLDVRTQSRPNAAAAVTPGCELKSAPSTSKRVESTVAVCPAIAAILHQQTGIKRPRSTTADDFDVPSAQTLPQKPVGASGNEVHPHISASKIEQPSVESSKLLSNEHEISDLLHLENSNALQLDSKPVEYALNAIKRFCSLEQENDKSASSGISEERCISLLENLRNMPHPFDPRVQGEAQEFAVEWKSSLMEKKPGQSNVVLFLEFLAAFGLTSSFPANDLLSLLDSNSGRKTSSDLCQILGLADKIPVFIESLIQRNQRIEAAKYVHVLGIIDEFPIIGLLSDHWNYSKMTGQRLCEKYNHSIISQIEAITAERDALTAIINCFEAYNLQSQGQISPEILRERIVLLEKQKAQLEVESDKAKLFARSKSISLEQQKESNNCSFVATANAGQSGPKICPNPTVVSAPPITGTSQSPDFSSTAAPNPVTVSSSATTSASTDKPDTARTVNLSLDTASPTVTTSNSLPPTNPTHKFTGGASPLPTADPTAAKAVGLSSTSAPPSTTISKTQPLRQAKNKRRKVVVSSGHPLKPKHDESAIIHPMQSPQHQMFAAPFMCQNALYSGPPARYHSLENLSRTNFRRNNY